MAALGAGSRFRGLRVPRDIDLQVRFPCICIQIHNQRVAAAIAVEIHTDRVGLKAYLASVVIGIILEVNDDGAVQHCGPAPTAVDGIDRIRETTMWTGQSHLFNLERFPSRRTHLLVGSARDDHVDRLSSKWPRMNSIRALPVMALWSGANSPLSLTSTGMPDSFPCTLMSTLRSHEE